MDGDSGNPDYFTNYGTLQGNVGLEDGENRFLNYGTFTGDYEGSFNTTGETIHNRGTIVGDVNLGSGEDRFDSRGGTVDGVIDGGFGADVFLVDQQDVEIMGGAGNDTVLSWTDFTALENGSIQTINLRGDGDTEARGDLANNNIMGNVGDNLLLGLNGNDTIAGGAGNDTVGGNAGADVLFGGTGDDSLSGGSGSDTLLGQDDDDVLRGGDNSDRLSGGNGNDTLDGESGRDILAGGLGADVFLFTDVTHSGVTGSTADRIEDFDRGTDLIDLTDLGGGDLVWRGTGGFLGGGNASFRYGVFSGDAIVRVDDDGDGTTDMLFFVEDTTGLNINDFIF